MISQQGRVVAISDDEVVVHVGGVSGCPTCDAGNGCGAGIFGRLLRDRKTDIRLENSIGAKPGQLVSIGIPENRFLKLVFSLYVLPLIAGLLGVIAGFVISNQFGFNDWVSDLSGLICGVIAAAILLLRGRRMAREFPGDPGVHLQEAVSDLACAKSRTSAGNLYEKR